MRGRLAVIPFLVVLAAAGGAHAETVVRIGTVAPDGSVYMREMRAFASEIERLSDGEVTFKWYPGGRLGDDKALAEALLADGGRIEGAALTGIGLARLAPEFAFWIYPGLFRDVEEVDLARRLYRADFERWLEERGFVLVVWGDVGFLRLMSDRPIAGLEELRQDRKLWLWADDDGAITAAKLAGIAFTPTSLGELAGALRKGTIDTWVYPPLAAIAMGIHGFAKHLLDLRFNYMVGAFVLRRDVFESLPEETRKVLRAVGRKWEPRLVKTLRGENEKAVEAMKRQGTKVMAADEAMRDALEAVFQPQRAAYAKVYGIEELMERFARDVAAFRSGRGP